MSRVVQILDLVGSASAVMELCFVASESLLEPFQHDSGQTKTCSVVYGWLHAEWILWDWRRPFVSAGIS